MDTVIYRYDDADWGDLLTSYDGKPITYDQIGNPLRIGSCRYSWEHGRQLASMFDGKNTAWYFTYDASGMRTSRTDGTTTYSYVYNGGLLSKMTVGDNVLEFAYDASGTPMTITYNGTIYYYLTNIQGDVVSIVDADGVLLVHYVYDAWGNLLSTEGTMAGTLGVINPLRYRGYVYDTETELYYLQSRYYNPQIGRFINADNYIATGQGFVGNNMFAYCLNNPVCYSDSTGHIPTPVSWQFTKDRTEATEDMIKYKEAVESSTAGLETVKDEVTYISHGIDNGATIENSYLIRSPSEMTEFVEANRGDEVSGTTAGIVFEWRIHNLVYEAGRFLDSDYLIKKGKDLDVANTLFADDHSENVIESTMSMGMKVLYILRHPFSAWLDSNVERWGGNING